MVDNIEYTINHGLSYETANYLQNMGDGRLMPVPVRAIALDFPRFAIMHDHAATGDRIEYNALEYQIVGPVRRYLGWAIFQVKQAMARGAAWVPNFTPGAPRARDIVQRVGGVVLLDAPGNSIGPGVTFSRADQAMVCDEAGNWTWTVLPYRRSFDVTTKEWGYLFEPARTNATGLSTPKPEDSMMGIVVTASSETLAGFPSARITATAADQPRHENLFGYPDATRNGAYSMFAKIPAGTYLVFGDYDGTSDAWCSFDSEGRVTRQSGGYTGSSVKYPDGVVRVSVYRNRTSKLTGIKTILSSNPDNAQCKIGATALIGMLQSETGPIVTSPIATNGAAKTVAADVCTYQNNVLTATTGSVLARFYNKKTYSRVLAIGGNSMLGTGSPYQDQMWDGTTEVFINYQTEPGLHTAMTSYGSGSMVVTGVGVAEATSTNSPAWSIPNLPNLGIGGTADRDRMSGYINHLSAFPTQLDAATRQLMLSVVQ